ncbi:DUF7009 family protein [Flavimarina sp. Hel_I_48]|uniref:DUF7009 family protein n=1 Tax=Flavimarina sp. Hel_I_48 TaxID=1392488 RepID=UPI0004DF40F3|nr:hypothetical protein [Flavimarina sp. Hel_I_48]
MKIRIKQNSIRFRLTRSEVEQVCKQGHYEEETDFNSGQFRYSVCTKEGIENLEAYFIENRITLYLPDTYATQWLDSEQVGFEHNMPLENGKELLLLLEKDFVCMDDNREDQSDNYPNPMAEKLR